MTIDSSLDVEGSAIMLRFRDLVTEPGGNIAEHRRIIDELGFAWWGWWARGQETTPVATLSRFISTESHPARIILFDSGQMEFHSTLCTKVVTAPSKGGISSPDFRATPHYYVRGRYPAWFRFHGDIRRVEPENIAIKERPTLAEHGFSEASFSRSELEKLREESATFWVVDYKERR